MITPLTATGDANWRSWLADYAAISKPRVTGMAIFATAVGFYMAHTGPFTGGSVMSLILTMSGAVLVGAGASAFNQTLEREFDAQMSRTADRPLPSGRITPRVALTFGTVVSIVGLLVLAFCVNLASTAVAAITLATYLLAYTPLKRLTPLAVVVGAVPGALPTVIGWTAATGRLDIGAWLLFAIIFLWQVPHFLAIAWMYRQDYARAGFATLPTVDPTGKRTVTHMILCTFVLIPVSLLPTYFGLTGRVYYMGTLIGGLAFLAFALEVARLRTRHSARQHVLASLAYLGCVFLLMMFNKTT